MSFWGAFICICCREALSSPAIQKEVKRIEAMEMVVDAAKEQSKCHSNHAQDDNLREAIKAYEETK